MNSPTSGTQKPSDIPQFLRTLLADSGMTQEELATHVQMSAERMSNLIRGRVKRLRPTEIEALAKARAEITRPPFDRLREPTSEKYPADEAIEDQVQKPLRAKVTLYQGQPYAVLFDGPLRLCGAELSAHDLQRLGEQFVSIARIFKTSASSKAIEWVTLS